MRRNCQRPARLSKNSQSAEGLTRRIAAICPRRAANTYNKRTMSPGAFKQRRGSGFGFAKRSVIYADSRCELTFAWPSRALSYHDIILSAAVFRPSRHYGLSHRRDPAHAGVCCTFPVESSLLHCCGTDVLPKEGTFHFRPALVSNCGSFQMIRFLRKNVNFIRDFWRSRFAVKLSHIRWDSR
jgi:hypothetical protein